MTIIGQIRMTRDVYRLRDRVVAAEDELAQALASSAGSPGDTSAEAVGPEESDVPVIRHKLAQLLREQANLLEMSRMARLFTLLPTPGTLREDADRLDESGSEEPTP